MRGRNVVRRPARPQERSSELGCNRLARSSDPPAKGPQRHHLEHAQGTLSRKTDPGLITSSFSRLCLLFASELSTRSLCMRRALSAGLKPLYVQTCNLRLRLALPHRSPQVFAIVGQGGLHTSCAMRGRQRQQTHASISNSIVVERGSHATRVLANQCRCGVVLLGCFPAVHTGLCSQWLRQIRCVARVARRACAPSADLTASRSWGSAGTSTPCSPSTWGT